MIKFILIILILLLAAGGALFVMSSHSALAFDSPAKSIGASTPFSVHVTNAHGVRRVTARIEQNGTSTVLTESSAPANRTMFWRAHTAPQTVHFDAGKKHAPGLVEGKA